HAAEQGVPVVGAAGNHRSIGSSALLSHPWVVPVVSCDVSGRPQAGSNLSARISRRSVSAPGEEITSLGEHARPKTLSGTSVAAAFVTGAIALLWSEFPKVSGTIHLAITGGSRHWRSMVPP